MSESLTFDAVILGEGIAGFTAAVALHARGKKVAVVSRAPGALSVSSGIWDVGPLAKDRPFDAAVESAKWKTLYGDVLCERALPPTASEWKASLEASVQELSPTLTLQTKWDRPFQLPAMSGRLRPAFVAQRVQALGDVPRSGRVAVVASRRWRFRGDLLSRCWTESARALGFSTEFHAADLPLEGDGWDLPLPLVAAGLAREEEAEKLAQAVSRLTDSVDALLFPPLFPSDAVFDRVRAATRLPMAEAVAACEPVPGFRLCQAIRQGLEARGIARFESQKLTVQPVGGRVRDLTVVHPGDRGWVTLNADTFVLASGRYFGGGIAGGYQRVEETIFALPLYQTRQGPRFGERRAVVEGKADWNRLGLKVDEAFRPLAEDGRPAFQNLVAGGSVLGGVDFAAHAIGLGFHSLTGRLCVASVA